MYNFHLKEILVYSNRGAITLETIHLYNKILITDMYTLIMLHFLNRHHSSFIHNNSLASLKGDIRRRSLVRSLVVFI